MKSIKSAALLALLVLTAPFAGAQWLTYNLPPLSSPFGVGTMGHLSDGRYLYAATGQAWIQDAWASASFTELAAGSYYFDPSFVAVANDSLAYIGSGGWGATDILSLNPSTPVSPDYAPYGPPVQNYRAVVYDATSLYIGGGFGSGTNMFSSPNHAIGLFDGSTNRIVIDNISAFSAGFDRDAAGNLYVASSDNNTVYFFTAAQLASALDDGPLGINDGVALFTFQSSSSIAVDGLGRIWASGYLTTGIEVYDPDLDLSSIFTPGANNENYQVLSFERDGVDYVGWLNNADWDTDADMVYGYAEASALVVPEPSSMALLALGVGTLAMVLHARRKG